MKTSESMQRMISRDPAYEEKAVGIAFIVLVLAVLIILMIVATWKMYVKAGQPGWASIIPIYDAYILFKLAWGNGWLFLLLCIPFVDAIVYIMLLSKIAKAYGKGFGMFLLLLFFNPIAVMMLGFGKAVYTGPSC